MQNKTQRRHLSLFINGNALYTQSFLEHSKFFFFVFLRSFKKNFYSLLVESEHKKKTKMVKMNLTSTESNALDNKNH